MSEPITVPGALDGERVDRVVAMLTGWSRGDVQQLLDDGAVVVGGKEVAKSYRLREGDVIELLAEPEPDQPPQADASVPVAVASDRRPSSSVAASSVPSRSVRRTASQSPRYDAK